MSNTNETELIGAVEQARVIYERAVMELARWRLSNSEPPKPFRSIYCVRGPLSFGPEAVKVSSREYIRQNDVLSNFLDEACDVDSRNRAEVGATFEAFKSWGGDLSKKRLGTLLLTKFDQYRDGKTRYWTGFKVRL